MERSAIRDSGAPWRRAPDFAALHPGYDCYTRSDLDAPRAEPLDDRLQSLHRPSVLEAARDADRRSRGQDAEQGLGLAGSKIRPQLKGPGHFRILAEHRLAIQRDGLRAAGQRDAQRLALAFAQALVSTQSDLHRAALRAGQAQHIVGFFLAGGHAENFGGLPGERPPHLRRMGRRAKRQSQHERAGECETHESSPKMRRSFRDPGAGVCATASGRGPAAPARPKLMVRRGGGKDGSACSPYERSDMRDQAGRTNPACRSAHADYACWPRGRQPKLMMRRAVGEDSSRPQRGVSKCIAPSRQIGGSSSANRLVGLHPR